MTTSSGYNSSHVLLQQEQAGCCAARGPAEPTLVLFNKKSCRFPSRFQWK